MKRFSFEVKLFALDHRQQGKGWGEIRRAIRDRFGIDPPTVRSLQKWEQGSALGVLDQALKDRAKQEAESAKQEALRRVVQDLPARLIEAREAGEDVEYAGWRWFFSAVESLLGAEKFRAYLDRYRGEELGPTSDMNESA